MIRICLPFAAGFYEGLQVVLRRAADVGIEVWTVTGQMAPYLLFGFFAAGCLSVLLSPEFVERHLGRGRFMSIFKAALFGVPLPLCSCGVIPVGASLRRHGAGRGATTAFLISTPQTGVDSILVTYSLLGPVFAVFRPLAALISGLFGGVVVAAFDVKNHSQMSETFPSGEASGVGKKSRGKIIRIFTYAFSALPQDLAKSLIMGLVIAGLLSAFIPRDFFARGLLGKGIIPMLVMMVVGIPIYVCATASVPVAASLVLSGLSPGAALVFLMTGPATNAATITTIWKFMGRRTAILYLATVALSALGAGLLLDGFVDSRWSIQPPDHVHATGMTVFQTISALVLLGVLVPVLVGNLRSKIRKGRPLPVAEGIRLRIEGMTCSHCAESVRRTLIESSGVESVEVDLRGGVASIIGKDLEFSALCRAVETVGFKAFPFKEDNTQQ